MTQEQAEQRAREIAGECDSRSCGWYANSRLQRCDRCALAEKIATALLAAAQAALAGAGPDPVREDLRSWEKVDSGFRKLNEHHTEHHERDGTELLLDADVAEASMILRRMIDRRRAALAWAAREPEGQEG